MQLNSGNFVEYALTGTQFRDFYTRSKAMPIMSLLYNNQEIQVRTSEESNRQCFSRFSVCESLSPMRINDAVKTWCKSFVFSMSKIAIGHFFRFLVCDDFRSLRWDMENGDMPL